VNGTIDLKIKRVTGLEALDFTDASVPIVGINTNSLAVDATAKLESGVEALVGFKVCQSGSCTRETEVLVPSGPLEATARGSITATPCTSGAPELAMTIERIDITALTWDTSDLEQAIENAIESTFGLSSADWLGPVLEDLFNALTREYATIANESILPPTEQALNDVLKEVPLISCGG
jgi:hypothetical protein